MRKRGECREPKRKRGCKLCQPQGRELSGETQLEKKRGEDFAWGARKENALARRRGKWCKMWGHRYGGDEGNEACDWLNAFINPRLPLVDVKYCVEAVPCAQGDLGDAFLEARQRRRESTVDVSVGVKHGENRVVSHLASNLISRPPLVSSVAFFVRMHGQNSTTEQTKVTKKRRSSGRWD